MARKWLELAPWQKRREGPITGAGNNGGGDGKSAKEDLMPEEQHLRTRLRGGRTGGHCRLAGGAVADGRDLPRCRDHESAKGI